MNRLINKSQFTFRQSKNGSLFNSYDRYMDKGSKYIKSVVLNYNGTVIDPYSIAQCSTLRRSLAENDIPISWKESREPDLDYNFNNMYNLITSEAIYRRWCDMKLTPPTHNDILNIQKRYNTLLPMNLLEHSKTIDGTSHTFEILKRDYNLKIGGISEFNENNTHLLDNQALHQGVEFDVSSTTRSSNLEDNTTPFKLYKLLGKLKTNNIYTVLRVSSTISGIRQGLNAGCWTVGVTRYSNYMCINTTDTISVQDIEKRNTISGDKLQAAGAHYIIDSINDLPIVLNDINDRMQEGEFP